MAAYFQCSSVIAAILTILSAAVFALFASFKLGRSLLEKVTRIPSNSSRSQHKIPFFTVSEGILVRGV